MSVTAKTVILDIKDNHGGTDYVAMLCFEFYLNGTIISNIYSTNFYSNETSRYMSSTDSKYLFDTSTPDSRWASALLTLGSQRVYCNFNTATEFDEIRVVNNHSNGGSTDNGANNVVVTITPDSLTSKIYEETISNGTVIFDGVIPEHSSVDERDEFILFLDESVEDIDVDVSIESNTPVVSSYVSGIPAGPPITANAIYFDILSNWGNDYSGIRQIDFYYLGVKVPLLLSDIVGTGVDNYGQGGSYAAYYAFDTTLDKDGSSWGKGWVSSSGSSGGVRIGIILESSYGSITFDEIRINNHHNSGAETDRGVKVVKITATLDKTESATYLGAIIDAIDLGTREIEQHPETDIEYEQVIDSSMNYLENSSVKININTAASTVSSFVQSALPAPTADAYVELESEISTISGLTVNEADVPYMLLIQSESIDGDTNFCDASHNNIPVYNNGIAQHSETFFGYGYPYFGTTAGWVGDSGNSIQAGPSSIIPFGLGDFTIDLWHFGLGSIDLAKIIQFTGSPTDSNYPYIYIDGTGSYYLKYSGASGGSVGDGLLTGNQNWRHYAWVRRDGILYYYVDGILQNSVVDTTDYDTTTITLGGESNFAFEEFRVSHYARWTDDFTPDTTTATPAERFIGNFNVASNIAATVVNSPPDKTYINGQPWVNQFGFNESDPTTIGAFTQGADFPTGISHGYQLIVGDKAYILGGTTGYTSIYAYDPPAEADQSAVYYANINSDGSLGTWTETTSLPHDRYGGQIFETYKRIFIVGGKQFGVETTTVITAPINDDGSLGEWETTYSLNSSRLNFALSVTKNRVYVFGGYTYTDLGSVALSSYEYAPINYDGTIGEWEYAGDIPSARGNFFSQYTGSKIYLIGGGTLTTSFATISADISNEGVIVSDWTTESWTVLPSTSFVCSSNRLFIIGGNTGNFSSNSITYRDIDEYGVISSTETDLGYTLPENVYSPIVFLTDSKIHVIGGVSNDDPAYDDERVTVATTSSADFTGVDVDYADETSVAEFTAIPITVKYIPSKASFQSYFGYGSSVFGDIEAPVPEVSGLLRYTEFIDVDFETLPSEIESTAWFMRYISVDYNSYASTISSLSADGGVIDVNFNQPVPVISSYNLRAEFLSFQTEVKSKLPVIESYVSCPVAIWGNIKSKHPNMRCEFRSITNINSYPPTIDSIVSNPIAISTEVNTSAPVMQFVTSNPEVINSYFNTKHPVIKSSVYRNETINCNINSYSPKIKSSTLVNINIDCTFVTDKPTIHGVFEMEHDYDVIKFDRQSGCTFN